MTYQPTYPDYGIYPRQIPAPEIDLGELAARLGASSSYRRTGRVIWIAKFLDESEWIRGGPGYVSISVEQKYHQSASLKMTGLITEEAAIAYRVFPPLIETAGIELYVYPQSSITGGPRVWPKRFKMSLIDSNSVNSKIYSIAIEWNLNRIMVQGNNVYTIPYMDFQFPTWYNVKLTVDLENQRYGELYFDKDRIPISNLSPSTGSTYGTTNIIYLESYNEGGYDNSCYVGDLLFTTNENINS